MSELFIGVVGMVLLYCLGNLLYRKPPIQQDLIKMEDKSDE